MDPAIQLTNIGKEWSIMKRWILPLGMVAAAIIISIFAYDRLPEQVPIHWNIHGEVDRYASKPLAMFLMPAAMLIVMLTIRVAPVIDPKRKNLKKNIKDIDSINFFTMLVLLGIHVVTIIYGMGYEFDMSVIAPLIAGALFLVIGNYLPRFKHNYSIGVRTPWTLANEEVWRKSNLIAGRFFFFGGLIMLLSILMPRLWMMVVVIGTIIVCGVVPFVISFILFRQSDSAS